METQGFTPPTGGSGNSGFTPQYLSGGKILTGANFPNFVQTWNWMVDFIRNLKGDGDNLTSDGYISVDRSNEKWPVIRTAKALPEGGGGESIPTWKYGRFRVYEVDKTKISLRNCYIFVTGKYYGGTDTTVSVDTSENSAVVWAELDIKNSKVTIKADNITIGSSTFPWQSSDYSTVAIPLYLIRLGQIEEDYRIGPYLSVYV